MRVLGSGGRVNQTADAKQSQSQTASDSAQCLSRLHTKAGDFVCPIELPQGQGGAKENQEPFYDDLHKVIVDGNGHNLKGLVDGSGREIVFVEWKGEIKCLYSMMLKDGCGGLKSQFDTRQRPWEYTCLDANKDLLETYDLMTPEEKHYFRQLKDSVGHLQIYQTYMEITDYKEIVCIVMKTIDDECVAFKSPRMMAPGQHDK